MKIILLILVPILFNVNRSFAQEKSSVAIVHSKSTFLEGKTNGKFKFTLPSHLTKEEVEKSSFYYVHNFTVNFDHTTRIAEINMVSNDGRSRHIIVRFLSACGIQYIEIESKLIGLYPFYETYLK
jgi:hypothetical protein